MKLKTTIVLLLTIMCAIGAAAQEMPKTGTHKGKVISTMNSGGYTYVEFEEKDQKLWAASKQFKVSVGDTIEFSNAATMKNFYSRTLDRTFETILFASYIIVEGSLPGKTPAGHPVLPKGHMPLGLKAPAKVVVKPGAIEKAENGYTVEECHAMKDSLAGKVVKVRGKVVKFTTRIMGKNWIHIRDGSGKEGSNDLTVTTKQEAKVGDVILVTGKMAVDKDLGAGYVYEVIIEEAKIVIE
jgi:hypothetical protein